MITNDAYTDKLLKVSNDDNINQYIKGIYSSADFDVNQITSIQLRKAYNTGNSIYLNQVIINTCAYFSESYSSEELALQHLNDFIPINYNIGETHFALSIIIDWSQVPIGNSSIYNINCEWIDISDMAANLKMAVELLKRRDFETSQSQISGWPMVHNNRIHFNNNSLNNKSITNYEENHIIDTISSVNEYCPGKENIVVEEISDGNFHVYETSNKIYGDINLIRKKALAPNVERSLYENVFFLDSPDGICTVFHLPDFLYSEDSLRVYKNGTIMNQGSDYSVVREHDVVVFTVAPLSTDLLLCSFISKKQHFYINTDFDGVNIVDLTVSDNKKVSYLDGIDSSVLFGNNFRFSRHGFNPMLFLTEPYYPDGRQGLNANNIQITGDPYPSSTSKVLLYEHGAPLNVSDCSRTECQINTSVRANRIVCDLEILIPSDVYAKLTAYTDAINWLTIQEYWEGRTASLVGGNYDDNTEHRLSLGLLKKARVNGSIEPLHFELWADDIIMNQDPISIQNHAKIPSNPSDFIVVPSGEWFKIHVEIWPGDETHGRFVLTMTVANQTTTVMDQTLRTICKRQCLKDNNYNFTFTRRPQFESFNTMKLYTSGCLADYMVKEGVNLKIKFRKHRLDCISAVQSV